MRREREKEIYIYYTYMCVWVYMSVYIIHKICIYKETYIKYV